MNFLFSTKEKITIAAIMLILAGYVLFAQFYFLSPLKSDLAAKQKTLTSEQNLLADLRKKAGSIQQNGKTDTTELQREVPVEPLQDQFILDLQHAEAVSNSQIKSMTFTTGTQSSTTNNASSNTNNTTNSNTNNTTNSNTNNSTNSNANSSGSQQPSSGTSGNNNQASSSSSTTAQGQNTTSSGTAQQSTSVSLSKLTVQLSVESQTYEDFEKFISTLESLKRITVVESITYTGPAEITSVDQDTKPFDYTLTVSAYYLPGLTDLESQLPKAEYPAPAGKVNPLVQYPDLTTP